MKEEIEKYCEEQGMIKAKMIDDSIALCIKPKPKWMPKWLYYKVIKDTFEIVELKH